MKTVLVAVLAVVSIAANAEGHSPVLFGFNAETVVRSDPSWNEYLDDDHPCASRHNRNDNSNHYCHAVVSTGIANEAKKMGANPIVAGFLGTMALVAWEATNKNFSAGDIMLPVMNFSETKNSKADIGISGDAVYVGFNMKF